MSHQEDPPPSDGATIMDDLVMREVLADVDTTKIRVFLFNDSIRLNVVKYVNQRKVFVEYVNQGEDYCTVEWRKFTENSERSTKKLEYHQKFLDVFFNDFPMILQIIKPNLRELDVLIDPGHDVRPTKIPMLQLFENYQKIMDFFDGHPLTIEKLKITVLGNSQISQILSKIETEELSIDPIFGGAESLDFEEIAKSGNWKCIKNLSVRGFIVTQPVTFIDKTTLSMTIDDISPEDVRTIVETFRNNPSMEKWVLFFFDKDHSDVMDLLVRELGRTSQKDEWYFTVPESQKFLHVSFWLSGQLIFHNRNKDEADKDEDDEVFYF